MCSARPGPSWGRMAPLQGLYGSDVVWQRGRTGQMGSSLCHRLPNHPDTHLPTYAPIYQTVSCRARPATEEPHYPASQKSTQAWAWDSGDLLKPGTPEAAHSRAQCQSSVSELSEHSAVGRGMRAGGWRDQLCPRLLWVTAGDAVSIPSVLEFTLHQSEVSLREGAGL